MSLITSVLTGGKTKTIPLSGGKEFALVDEAALEYDNVARQLFGEYARVNFGDKE